MGEFLELLAVYTLLSSIIFLSLYYGLWFIVLHLAQPKSMLFILFPRQENAMTIFLASCVTCIGIIGILVGISLCGDTLRTRAVRIDKMKAQEIDKMKAQERQRFRDQESDSEEIIIGPEAVSMKQKKVQ